MGLFGDIDATEVSDNPFYVAPDKYKCILTEATLVEKKDQSGHGLSFKWVIEDEDSEYEGFNLSDWNDVFLDLTTEEFTADIKKKTARTKQRLSQMGLDNDQMNTLLDDDNLDLLIGMEAYVEVVETPDKNDPDKKWTNIKSVERIFDED